jgi:hypothetical protein
MIALDPSWDAERYPRRYPGNNRKAQLAFLFRPKILKTLARPERLELPTLGFEDRLRLLALSPRRSPPIDGFFITTKPDRSRCSTGRADSKDDATAGL